MNLISLLGSGPIVALLGHVVTAGLTYLLAKGYVTPDTLGGIATAGTIIANAAASGARSTGTAAAKAAAKAGLVAVPASAVSDPTWSDPNAR